MNILITGAAGFLGSHLAEYFVKQGHLVIGIDNMSGGSWDNVRAWQRNKPSTYFIQLDCGDFKHIKEICTEHKIDIVYHTAALPHEGLSVFSPSLITKSIYGASVSVFSAAISSGVKRIVNMSSMARYGKTRYAYLAEEPLPFAENMIPEPIDPYGIAKFAAEETLWSLCETHGVEFVNLVPHNIIGTRQNYTDPHRNVVSIMMNRLKQGKDVIIYGDGTQTRCFSPVADIIGSIVEAGNLNNTSLNGHTINIGPDRNATTIISLAERIYKLAGRDFKPIFMPDRPREVKHALCSSDKARQMLGYKEVQSLDACLLEMWQAIPEGGAPFVYDNKPLEIVNELTPKTWTDRLI